MLKGDAPVRISAKEISKARGKRRFNILPKRPLELGGWSSPPFYLVRFTAIVAYL